MISFDIKPCVNVYICVFGHCVFGKSWERRQCQNSKSRALSVNPEKVMSSKTWLIFWNPNSLFFSKHSYTYSTRDHAGFRRVLRKPYGFYFLWIRTDVNKVWGKKLSLFVVSLCYLFTLSLSYCFIRWITPSKSLYNNLQWKPWDLKRKSLTDRLTFLFCLRVKTRHCN